MKKTIKTVLPILLCALMLFASAGCGSKAKGNESVDDDFFTDDVTSTQGKDNSQGEMKNASQSDQNKDTSTPATNKVGGKSCNEVLASMPKELKGTKIVMYNWNPPAEYTGAATAMEEFKEKTGVTVEWSTVSYDVYVSKLSALIAAGKAPDVVRTRTPEPFRLASFQSLSSANFDFTDQAWDQTLMKDYTVNGVTYATSLKNTHLGTVTMMFYNKTIIDRYNLENPYLLWKNGKWTVSKFIKMCEDYQKASNANLTCVGLTYETWTQLYGVQGPIGYDGSKYFSMANDNKYLTTTQEVAGYFNSKLFGAGRAEVFNAGDALFYAGASVLARRNNSYFGSLKTGGSMYLVPMPSVDGQSVYYQQKDEYEAYAIAKGAKNPQAVPYFLRYFLDGENYDLNGFFCNKQNLEVYNWCMNQQTTIWTPNTGVIGNNYSSVDTGIYTQAPNQVKSYIDSNAPLIQKAADEFNEAVSKLTK